MSSPHNDPHTHSSASDFDEPDRPPTGFIAAVVLVSFVSVAIIWAIAYPLLWKSADTMASKVETGMQNHTRLEYIRSQNEILSSYKKLDDGSFQIPIEEAMKESVKLSQ